MTAATERLEFRVSSSRARRLRAAAEVSGETLTDFVLDPADRRADDVLETNTLVPSDYFDDLLAAMDRAPQILPGLADAAKRSQRVEHR